MHQKQLKTISNPYYSYNNALIVKLECSGVCMVNVMVIDVYVEERL